MLCHQFGVPNTKKSEGTCTYTGQRKPTVERKETPCETQWTRLRASTPDCIEPVPVRPGAGKDSSYWVSSWNVSFIPIFLRHRLNYSWETRLYYATLTFCFKYYSISSSYFCPRENCIFQIQITTSCQPILP